MQTSSTVPEIDPRHIPHYEDSPDTAAVFDNPRLDQDAVARYFREGYLVYDKPVLRRSQFEGLKAHFALTGQVDRPR